MGLGLGFSRCSCGDSDGPSGGIQKGELNMIFGNPKPKNFHIKEAFVIGDFVSVVVNYPDCINFEGNKIMVYEATLAEVTAQAELDPHFCSGDHLSPIARFRPDKDGRFRAIQFMDMLQQERDNA